MNTETQQEFSYTKSRRLQTKYSWRDQILGPKVAPYIFITPFFILFALFWVFPVVWSFILSFQRWSARETVWVGLTNYQVVLANPAVRTAFSNMVWYVVVNNVFQFVIAMLLAVLLDLSFLRRASGLFRTAIYMPNLVSGVATGILFAIILGAGGLAIRFLAQFGIEISFLNSTQWSKPAVILAGGWRWIGYWVVIFMAGLQSIPDDYYEVAELDGATLWQRFRFITFPLLRPVVLFMLVINTIGTLQIFEEPFILFSGAGGPLGSATTPVLEMYRLGFANFDLGGAAALGWILAAIIMIISAFQLLIARRRGWTD
jgi:lactose/L-arabinose transport system permease protein